MRVRFQEDAFGRIGPLVRAEHQMRPSDVAADIVFRNQEERRVDAAVILDHEVDDGVLGARAARLRDFGERLAGQRLQRVIPEADEEDILRPAGELKDIFPALRRRAHFRDDALSDFRVFKARDPGVVSALLHPGRHGGVKSRRARRIGVDVRRDVDARAPRRVKSCKTFGALAPVRAPRRLQVIDLRARVRGPRDRDRLVDRLKIAIALRSHMRDVAAAEFRRRLRQRDQLIRFRIKGGRVNQRRADAERALAHRFAHEVLHAREFVRLRRAVFIAEFVNAHRRRADEGRDIRRHAARFKVVEIIAKARPRNVEPDVALLLQALGAHGVGQGAHRPALAEDFKRHALKEVALAAPVLDQRFGRPAQYIDEPRRDRPALRVDDRFGGRFAEIADRRDAVALDRDIGDDARRAHAVIDRPPTDDCVIRRRGGASGESSGRRCGEN